MAPTAVNGTAAAADSSSAPDQISSSTSPNPAPFSLVGKTIVITGGGRGLGLTLAHAVVEAGGQVACLDILPEPLPAEWASLVKLSKASHHPDPFPIYRRCDIANETQLSTTLKEISQLAEDSGATFSGIVACAGIQQQVPALEYGAKDFENVLRVNVTGTFLTAKWAARIFIEKNTAGSIVMIASMSGQIANRGLTCTAYNSSKSAVHQMCRSVAQEWGHYNIRVNTLSPGYIRTPMTDQLLEMKPDVEKTWMAGALLGRLAIPEDIKAPAVFLLADGSGFMTGTDLRVDGGHCASA